MIARRRHDPGVVHNLMFPLSATAPRRMLRSHGGDAPESGPSSETSTVVAGHVSDSGCPLHSCSRVRGAPHTVINDACLMGMPNTVGPVANLGLLGAILY